MAKYIERIAAGLGAKVVGKAPHTGGGAFGAGGIIGVSSPREASARSLRAGRSRR
jgi:hypothetical protein